MAPHLPPLYLEAQVTSETCAGLGHSPQAAPGIIAFNHQVPPEGWTAPTKPVKPAVESWYDAGVRLPSAAPVAAETWPMRGGTSGAHRMAGRL